MQRSVYQESYITCPYEPSHRILAHRFATHLTKCRRNHPHSPKEACPFNGSHVIATPELKHHMQNCPDRDQLDSFITKVEDVRPIITVNLSNDPVFEEEENWDTNSPSYDPSEYCAQNKLLMRFDVGTKTEHREHTVMMRRRFQELDTAESGSSHPSNVPRANIQRLPPATQRKETPPPAITTHFKALTLTAPQAAPPLSEILSTARAPGACSEEDSWHKVPTRGRGRGRGNRTKNK